MYEIRRSLGLGVMPGSRPILGTGFPLYFMEVCSEINGLGVADGTADSEDIYRGLARDKMSDPFRAQETPEHIHH